MTYKKILPPTHAFSQLNQSKQRLSNKIKQRALLANVGIFCTAISLPVNAQEQATVHKLEVITVTAEKRDSDIMDVSSSISAVSDSDLKDAEIASISELGQHVPNLHIFTWGGQRENNIFIRGIGPGLFTDPTVGFYVDGVNYTNSGMFNLDMADVEQIEVLRGPQGTLYGGNSLAGVINITTKKASDFTEAKVSVSADTLEQRKINLSVNTPLIEDKLYGGLSLSVTDNNGHLENIYNNEDYGAQEDIIARAKLSWKLTQTLTSDIIFDYQKSRGDSYALGSADFIKNNPDKVDHNFDGEDNIDAFGVALSIKKEFDAVDFTSVTSWRDWDSFNSADQDGSSSTTFISHNKIDERVSQLSQELRWASNHNEKLQWLGGLYGYFSNYHADSAANLDYTAIGWGGPYSDSSAIKKDDSGYAAFTQIDYSLTEKLTITAGLRLDIEKRKADIKTNNQSTSNVDIQGTKDFTEWLPKLGLSYKTDDSSLIYTTVSRGYRAGGFDHLYPNQEDPTFDSETSTNYELGYKSSFLNNTLELNTALFYIDIKDQQVQQLVSSTNTILTDNAGKGRSQGIEFESRYTPAIGWLIEAGGSYTNAEYKEYENCNFMDGTDCNGNKMANTPELTANIAIQNSHPLGNGLSLFSRVDVMHIGEYYYDSLNTLKQDPYQLLNLKVGLEGQNWDAYFWVKNALDKEYSSVEFDFGSGHTVEAGDPRSIGLTLSAYY